MMTSIKALMCALAALVVSTDAHVRVEFQPNLGFSVRNALAPNANGVWSWGGSCGGSPHDGPRTEPRKWGAHYPTVSAIPIVKPGQRITMIVNLGFEFAPTHKVATYKWTAALKCNAPTEENVFKQSKAYDMPGTVLVPADKGRLKGGYPVTFTIPPSGHLESGPFGNHCTISILLKNLRYGGCVDVRVACPVGMFWNGTCCQRCTVCSSTQRATGPVCDGTTYKDQTCELFCPLPAEKKCSTGGVVKRYLVAAPGKPCCSFAECPKPQCKNCLLGQPYTCPAGTQRAPNSDNIYCRNGVMCDMQDCCEPMPRTCGTHTCDKSKGYFLKIGANAIECDNGVCTNLKCCAIAARCDTFVCQAARTVQYGLREEDPFGPQLHHTKVGKLCASCVCTEDECCYKPPSCAEDFKEKCSCGTRAKPNPEAVACKDLKCTQHDCCEKLYTCSQFECPKEESPKPNSENILCLASTCRMKGVCCDPNPKCENFSCVKMNLFHKTDSESEVCVREIPIESLHKKKKETPNPPPATPPAPDEPVPPPYRCARDFDLYFVLDRSTSIGDKRWPNNAKFVESMFRAFGAENIRGAITLFAKKGHLHQKFTDDKDIMNAAVQRLYNIKTLPATNSYGGIKYAYDEMVANPAPKDRATAVFIVSDGRDNQGKFDEAVALTDEMTKMGADVYVIPVGDAAKQNRKNFEKLATKPTNTHIWEADDYTELALQKFIDELAVVSCEMPPPPPPPVICTPHECCMPPETKEAPMTMEALATLGAESSVLASIENDAGKVPDTGGEDGDNTTSQTSTNGNSNASSTPSADDGVSLGLFVGVTVVLSLIIVMCGVCLCTTKSKAEEGGMRRTTVRLSRMAGGKK